MTEPVAEPVTVPVAPLLDVRGARIEFETPAGPTVVVDGVDLAVGPGEIVALVGESGSGKTMLALSLLQLVPGPGKITAGSASFAGNDLYAASERAIRTVRGNEIAMVFQEPMTSLNPLRTVGSQVAESLRLHGDLGRRAAAQRAVELLDMVGLGDPDRQARQYPHTLSGGMRQRVMIAMALACDPKLLIADEPTTALDVTIQAQILDLLVDLTRRSGTALLLVTHDLAVVAQYAQRVEVMAHGRIVERGHTLTVLRHPRAEPTKALLAAVPGQGRRRRPPPAGVVTTGAGTAGAVVVGGAGEPSPAPVLEVRGLCRDFVSRHGRQRTVVRAVADISFSIDGGRTLGLVGESGSGKSTTARLITRLLEPTAGAVLLGGTDVTALAPFELRLARREMQLVFQDPFASLDPTFTIEEVIAEPLRAHGVGDRRERPERVAELLQLVRLTPDHAKRAPHELSGGQRQRVAIARALALEPKLVICDEAVSSLDVSVQAQVLDLLGELQERLGLTYLFISHDLAVVRDVSDRVAVMRHGVIVEQGGVEQVYDDPQHDYTKLLLSSAPVLSPLATRPASAAR